MIEEWERWAAAWTNCLGQLREVIEPQILKLIEDFDDVICTSGDGE